MADDDDVVMLCGSISYAQSVKTINVQIVKTLGSSYKEKRTLNSFLGEWRENEL